MEVSLKVISCDVSVRPPGTELCPQTLTNPVALKKKKIQEKWDKNDISGPVGNHVDREREPIVFQFSPSGDEYLNWPLCVS